MDNFDITWILAAISLFGSFLNAKKKSACFYLWGIGEVFWFSLDVYNHTYGRAVLDAVSFVICIYGLFEWNKNKEVK